MKKLIAFSLILVILLFCFIGCDEKNEEYVHETFYGVARFSKIINGLIVYIPEYGEVMIPENDGYCTCFDGHGPNEENTYHLHPGDLIAINFKYEKSYDDHGVAIMETYPAKFDRKAGLIEVLRQDIKFDKTDSGYVFSFPSTEENKNASLGDDLYFVYHESKNGSDLSVLYATGALTDNSDGILTVSLTFHKDVSSFLEKYCNMSVELEWN